MARNKKTLQLKLEDAVKVDAHSYSWNTKSNMDYIVGLLPNEFEVKKISPAEITINTGQLKKSTLPIELIVDEQLPTSYRIYGEPIIEPNEVDVWYPEILEDSLVFIQTQPLLIKGEKETQNFVIDLNTLDGALTVKPGKVKVKMQVRNFAFPTI